jgi:hypothetical protein
MPSFNRPLIRAWGKMPPQILPLRRPCQALIIWFCSNGFLEKQITKAWYQLWLFGSDKKLVYQEIIPEACASIASLSLNAKGKEALFLGCHGKVWKFSVDG